MKPRWRWWLFSALVCLWERFGWWWAYDFACGKVAIPQWYVSPEEWERWDEIYSSTKEVPF